MHFIFFMILAMTRRRSWRSIKLARSNLSDFWCVASSRHPSSFPSNVIDLGERVVAKTVKMVKCGIQSWGRLVGF